MPPVLALRYMQKQEKASSKTLHLFFYQNTTNGLKRSKSCHFLTITRMKLASQVCDIGYWSYYFLATLPASTTQQYMKIRNMTFFAMEIQNFFAAILNLLPCAH